MKQLITSFITILIFNQLFNAQPSTSVGIGTSNPCSKAQPDITSTSKGVLLPRLTSAQQTGIGTPSPLAKFQEMPRYTPALTQMLTFAATIVFHLSFTNNLSSQVLFS